MKLFEKRVVIPVPKHYELILHGFYLVDSIVNIICYPFGIRANIAMRYLQRAYKVQRSHYSVEI
jgi:hypothetical protein